MYGHAPSPCPTCSDPTLRPAYREEQQGSLDHFQIGDRVRTTAQHRRLNYEAGDFFGHPGMVIGKQGHLLAIIWQPFEYKGHTIPERVGYAYPGNVEHVKGGG
jgi:hypothetical protein